MAKILFLSFDNSSIDRKVISTLRALKYEVAVSKDKARTIEYLQSTVFDIIIIYKNQRLNSFSEISDAAMRFQPGVPLIVSTNDKKQLINIQDNNVKTCSGDISELIFSIEDMLDGKKVLTKAIVDDLKPLSETERAELRKKRHLNIIKERIRKYNSEILNNGN